VKKTGRGARYSAGPGLDRLHPAGRTAGERTRSRELRGSRIRPGRPTLHLTLPVDRLLPTAARQCGVGGDRGRVQGSAVNGHLVQVPGQRTNVLRWIGAMP